MLHTRNAPLPAHTDRKQDTAKRLFNDVFDDVDVLPPQGFIPDRDDDAVLSPPTFFLPPSPEVVAEGATGVKLSHPGNQRGGSLCNRMLSMLLSLLYRVGAGVHFSHL